VTAYFDQKRSEVDRLDETLHTLTENGPGWPEFFAARDAFDKALVWDATLAAESPGFPSDLRAAIHRIVVHYSTACAPRTGGGPDYADDAAHNYGLRMMNERLHDLFHVLGRRRLQGYSDDPRRWLVELFANGEEQREQMAATTPEPRQ
jgi:hypothetical protein